MRSANVTVELTGAWECWLIDVPDDAPDPITPEWLNDNWGNWEYLDLRDSGYDQSEVTEAEEA